MKDNLYQGGSNCGTIIILFQSYFYIGSSEVQILKHWDKKASHKVSTKTHFIAESPRSGNGNIDSEDGKSTWISARSGSWGAMAKKFETVRV